MSGHLDIPCELTPGRQLFIVYANPEGEPTLYVSNFVRKTANGWYWMRNTHTGSEWATHQPGALAPAGAVRAYLTGLVRKYDIARRGDVSIATEGLVDRMILAVRLLDKVLA